MEIPIKIYTSILVYTLRVEESNGGWWTLDVH